MIGTAPEAAAARREVLRERKARRPEISFGKRTPHSA
jgi:hypothetical protein